MVDDPLIRPYFLVGAAFGVALDPHDSTLVYDHHYEAYIRTFLSPSSNSVK